jgi:5'-3' exonuclease
MGIPRYFKWAEKNAKDFICEKKDTPEFECFLLDLNSILHTVSNQYIRENDGIENIDNMAKQIILRIEEHIQVVGASRVILCIDGIAPLAKQKQQRQRRYRGAMIRQIIKEKYKQYHEKYPKYLTWDSNKITAGTPFMHRISEKIRDHFAVQIEAGLYVFSDSTEIGEGEFKIFQYLRTIPDTDHSFCVYGMDADLIMLSLVSSKSIYLYREKDNDSMSSLIFLNIQKLKTLLYEKMGTTIENPRVIYDYMFMSSLLGNDFLPHLPTLMIYHNGIEVLIHAYNELKKFLLDEDRNIIRKNFIEFLEILNSSTLRRGIGISKSIRKARIMPFVPKQPMTKKEFALHKNIHMFENNAEHIKTDRVNYNSDESLENIEIRYYQTYLPDCSLRTLQESYVNGLNWINQYYTKSCPDWRYYYAQEYAPTIQDLIIYLRDCLPEEIAILSYYVIDTESSAVTSREQLMMVCPSSSADVLGLCKEDVEYMKKHLPTIQSLNLNSDGLHNLNHAVVVGLPVLYI